MTPSPIEPSLAPKTISQDKMWAAAEKLEATFLAQMLKSAGLGQSRDSFGGGTGEDQFASFLLEAQAQKMVEAGGIGLAETIFNALKVENNDT